MDSAHPERLVHLLGLSQPAVSQHLAKLRAAGLATPLESTPGLEALAARRRTLDRVPAVPTRRPRRTRGRERREPAGVRREPPTGRRATGRQRDGEPGRRRREGA